jgi:hypothetical protein
LVKTTGVGGGEGRLRSPYGSTFDGSLTCGWVPATTAREDKPWAEKDLELTAQVVRQSRRPRYARVEEGEEISRISRERIVKLLPEPSLKVLPRKRVVEWTLLMDISERANEKGLPAFTRDERGVHLHGDGHA